MEKSFDLKPAELQTLNALEQDNLRANATYGVLARQMKETEQRIAQSEEAQRSFIRQCLRDRGVEQFPQARLEPGRIVCTLAEEMAPAGLRPNGGAGERDPHSLPEATVPVPQLEEISERREAKKAK